MRIIFVLFIITFMADIAKCQNRFNDSMMALRVTDSLPGKPKVYFTPGHQQRAVQFQKLFSGATRFYEQRYHSPFTYRIAVLDSLQWVKEKFAFGFLAYDTGWVFLPAVVKAPFFINVYGLSQDTAALNNYLQQKHLSIQQVSDAVYYVYSLHELGHYFTDENEGVIVPDMFANEMIATYFSYCYFKSAKNPELQKLVDFSSFIKTAYHPQCRDITAMDTLYSKMPMQNFKWFHCNIVLLCRQIYDKFGVDFIDYYLQTFRAGTQTHFTTQQVIDLLDRKCNGMVSKWATELTEEKQD